MDGWKDGWFIFEQQQNRHIIVHNFIRYKSVSINQSMQWYFKITAY